MQDCGFDHCTCVLVARERVLVQTLISMGDIDVSSPYDGDGRAADRAYVQMYRDGCCCNKVSL